MKFNGAEITIKLLENHGIKTIAGIPGGSNLPLYDALYKSNIKHILTRHEQGAGFLAQGISRSTGDVSVCFATSGPGATNLITAIADAKLDSIPMIAITGQVPHSLIGTDAFQEVDMYGLTVPITKHNFLVRSIAELFKVIPEAFKIAKEGRPGPVLIDIPKNVQTEVIDVENWSLFFEDDFVKNKEITTHYENIDEIVDLINNAKSPLIFAGGGIISGNASEDLLRFAEKSKIPVTTSLMGLGSFPYDNELYLGLIGMHGAPYTNYLINECDLLIGLGVRFDDRATGNIAKFCPNSKIIHVDIDPSEFNKIKNVTYSIKGDVKNILSVLTSKISKKPRKNWISHITDYRIKYPMPLPENNDYLHPVNLIETIQNSVSEKAIICTDVGQHQMWVAQNYKFKYPRTLLTSAGLGTMGFGIPAALGAALANPDKEVICFTGDGSILMNIQELATLADFDLNIKIIIFNNHHLGLVRQQQELFYEKHYMASKFITNPDFSIIAKGFGIDSYNIDSSNYSTENLKNILSKKGPILINIEIKEEENVLPMVPPGASNTTMIGGNKYE